MTWPQHPYRPVPPIGSPGPRTVALWPISERAMDLTHDRGINALQPAPPRTPPPPAFPPGRTLAAVILSSGLIALAWAIGTYWPW